MLQGKSVLAVVPARCGSKGIPNKNMRTLQDISLIGWAGKTLSGLSFIDARVISTDSAEYAQEGQQYGLEAPFLRPKHLSGDKSGAVETIQHALLESEKHFGRQFDIVLIIEPTSPLRTAEDVAEVSKCLVETGAHSVVTVSPVPRKFHPRKILKKNEGRLVFSRKGGNQIERRQDLEEGYYWRNGICYALTRSCLMDQGVIFTRNTLGMVIDRPIVNIDSLLEVSWAEFLLSWASE